MRAARETVRLLVAAWLGASFLFAARVAPAAFAVLPTRALAGRIVGEVLPVIFWSGALLAALDLAFEQRETMRERGWHRVRLALDGLALLACIVAQGLIGRRIDALRERIGPSLDALATSDPLRVEFGRLHAVSVLLMGVAMIALAFALALDISRRVRADSLAAASGRG